MESKKLQNIFEDYCDELSSFLSEYLRISAKVEFSKAEKAACREFASSVTDFAVLVSVEMRPLDEKIILEIPAEMGYCIIDRLSGGYGFKIKALRAFTEIEKILLHDAIRKMIGIMPETWGNVSGFLSRIEKNSNEKLVKITLSVKIGKTGGNMVFYVPDAEIEPIADEIEVEKTGAEISAVVGKTKITAEDFAGLQVGDVIPLDSIMGSDITVLVDDAPRFYAKPGADEGKNAVRISEIII